jgi:hypothetical protein
LLFLLHRENGDFSILMKDTFMEGVMQGCLCIYLIGVPLV